MPIVLGVSVAGCNSGGTNGDGGGVIASLSGKNFHNYGINQGTTGLEVKHKNPGLS